MEHKSLITLEDPKSIVSEAYRMLRTNLHYSNVDKKIKSIVVTSPNMSEGKTTTACNLAITLAQSGKKTLFVGADLRKPRGYKLFGVPNGAGLTTLVTEDVLPETVITSVAGVANLNLLTAGPTPPNPSEILLSNKMKELIKTFEEEYDYVIIDVPPVNSVTDASILSTIVDGVVLVISANETNKDSARNAVKSLKKVNAHILGAVLAKVDAKNSSYYYADYYSNDGKKRKRRKKKDRNKKGKKGDKVAKKDNNNTEHL